MNKGGFAGQRNVSFLPFEPAGGHIIPAQTLLPIPDFARVVAITLGSGTIRRLPSWAAYSEAVVLIFKAQINLIHSADLVLPNGRDIVTAVDAVALAVPIGDGRWSLRYGLLGADPQVLIAQDGFYKNENGLIDQWGRASLFGGGGSTTVTFPIEFPTSCFNVTANPLASPSSTIIYAINVETFDNETVLLSGNLIENGGVVSAPAMTALWRAIGY